MAKKSYKSMDDFATASGVSRPTLSKYFNDPSQIKEVTRKRIEAALKKSNFEPNLFARHLNRKRTRNIGILVPTMSDPFYVQVVSLIELAAALPPARVSTGVVGIRIIQYYPPFRFEFIDTVKFFSKRGASSKVRSRRRSDRGVLLATIHKAHYDVQGRQRQ